MHKVFGKYLGLALVFLVALVFLSIGTAGSAEGAEPYIGSIDVDGNTQLDTLISTNGWGGLGTVESPYVIENLEIDATGSYYAIRISNTDKYLEIKNCVLSGSDTGGIRFNNVTSVLLKNNTYNPPSQFTYGIYLWTCSNIVVDGNDLSDTDTGVYLESSDNNSIRFNNVSNSRTTGVYLDNSSGNTIANNTCNDTFAGILLQSESDWNVLDGNICNRSENSGISLDFSANNTVSNNTLYACGTGIALIDAVNNTVFSNNCSNGLAGSAAITLDYSHYNIIAENNCSYNYGGIKLTLSDNNTVSRNTILHDLSTYVAGNGIEIDSSNNNTISDNYCNGYAYAGIIISSYDSDSRFNRVLNNILSCPGVPDEVYGIQLWPYFGIISNNTITGNECFDNYYGLFILNSPNNTVASNIVHDNGGSGIVVRGSSGTQISYNILTGNGDSGIWLDSSDGCTVEFNSASDNFDGVYLSSSDNNIVYSNNFHGNTDGIFLDASSYNSISFNLCNDSTLGDGIYMYESHFNRLFNNNCDDNLGYRGIFLYASTNNLMENNSCNGSSDGISIYSTTTAYSTSNVIHNNTCNGNTNDGIWVQDHGSYTTITNNTCNGNTKRGVEISASIHCTIANNTCVGNTIGIWLKSESDWNVVDNNNCSENSQAGIYLTFSYNCMVSNNTCGHNGQGSYYHGGIVIDTSNDNLVSNNTCYGNPNAGVFFYASLGNALVDNALNDNGYGIRTDDFDSGIISGNEVQDNYYGMYLYNSDGNDIVGNNCTSGGLYHTSVVTVGIMLDYCTSNTITDNGCNHNVIGMHIKDSDLNVISNNNCDMNDNLGLMIGMKIDSSHQNKVLNNSCSNNSIGINGIYSDENEIIGNKCNNNTQYGINFYGISSDYDLICNNTCNNNGYGMWLEAMMDSTICNNTCNDNRKAGMAIIYRSVDNLIANNTIGHNGHQLVSDDYGMWYAGVGLVIDGAGDYNECNGNIIANNTIDGSRLYGISIMHSANNRIFGNSLSGNNNTTSAFDPMRVQAYDDGNNYWNATDYGNLWADWASPDSNGDGIVDEAYLIDGGTNMDLLPLAVSVAISSPVDGFFTGETSIDISGTAVSYFGVDHLTWHNAANGASGDCSGSDAWTATVLLADGDNVITVTMVDLHGSEANASITVVLDVIPPSLEITYPAEGAYVGSSVTVTWNGSDADSGIDYYQVSIEGMFFVNVTGSSYTINGLAEGTYTFLVSAYDAVGNYLDVSVTFTVDITAPTVNITSPADDFLSTSNSVTVTWNGSDTSSGVDHYEVSWEGGSPVTLLPGVNTYTFNDLSDGSHVLTVTVYDKAGLSSSDAVTVRVDTQPPFLTITNPVEGGYVASSDVTVTWAGFDAGTGVAYYIISIEGLFFLNTTGSSCTISDLADGVYTVLVSAYDALDNCRDEVVTFTVDTVAPTLAIDSPEEGQLFNTTSVTVTWSTTDANPGTVQVRFDGEAWATAIGDEFVKTALTDGHHTAYVKVTDAAGNFVEGMVNFTVDTTAPAVAFISPEEGSLVNSSTGIVEWTVDDAVSNVRVDGGAWIGLGPNTSWEYSLEDGEHAIEVMVTDLAGNSAFATLNITVDTVAPEAEVSPIGDDLELVLVVLVEFSEQMNQTSVSIVVTGVTGNLEWEGNAAIFTPSALYYNQEYAVQVAGKDLAGNQMEFNWTFSTRSVGNLTGLILDENGDPVPGVTVTAGGEFTALTDENGRFVFSNLSLGTYLFEVNVEGYEPFTFNATIEQGVTVDEGTVEMVPQGAEGEGDGDDGSIWLYVIIAIAVLAVVGIVAFILLRKK